MPNMQLRGLVIVFVVDLRVVPGTAQLVLSTGSVRCRASEMYRAETLFTTFAGSADDFRLPAPWLAVARCRNQSLTHWGRLTTDMTSCRKRLTSR